MIGGIWALLGPDGSGKIATIVLRGLHLALPRVIFALVVILGYPEVTYAWG